MVRHRRLHVGVRRAVGLRDVQVLYGTVGRSVGEVVEVAQEARRSCAGSPWGPRRRHPATPPPATPPPATPPPEQPGTAAPEQPGTAHSSRTLDVCPPATHPPALVPFPPSPFRHPCLPFLPSALPPPALPSALPSYPPPPPADHDGPGPIRRGRPHAGQAGT
jgi:hypothetical protein